MRPWNRYPARPSPREKKEELATHFRALRAETVRLGVPLSAEDANLQAAPFVSPPKWHLAHTTWFFETFVLAKYAPGYRPFHPRFAFLFNSYYESVGPFHARPQRGLLSRPSRDEIEAYRRAVDGALVELLDTAPDSVWAELAPLVVLGLQHEQQHQELLLMDTKFNFAANPLRPAYRSPLPAPSGEAPPLHWLDVAGGEAAIGHEGPGFAFDNETPRHRVLLGDFRLASRPVTNGEYRTFLEEGGYRDARLWLSDGWNTVKAHGWQAPLYWEQEDGAWRTMTLSGLRPLDPAEPVCHLSYFEADAFARWAGKRLPTEAEWERAATFLEEGPGTGTFLEEGRFHPAPASGPERLLLQRYGDVWEWTASPYVPYPRFRPLGGALGEYNGKFMCGQQVLRGGSCVTPASHVRASYRNFFPPDSRWQFSGLRLAEDLR